MNETIKMILDVTMPYVAEIIIAIISLIVARYVVPFIKNDMIPWLKEKKLYGTIKKFVQAVEKMAEAGVIDKCDKKMRVIELLEKNGIVVDDTVSHLIESCVKELDIITSTIYDEVIIETNEDVEVKTEEPEVIIDTDNV